MSNTGKRQHRDAVFQKVYELAHGRVVEPVRFGDLEKETGIEKVELLNIVSYFVQKKLLVYEQGFVNDTVQAIGPGERDHSYLRQEPFIHLTAEGVDYYENGFNSPSQPSTVNYYKNVFERDNYGPLQQGGSHNNQDTSLRVDSSAPQATPTSAAELIPGLEEIDIKVLKAACEEAIRKGDRGNPHIYTEVIASRPELSGVSVEDLDESLQVLASGYYIEPVGHKVRDIKVFMVTLLGFERYAQVFVENYGSIFMSVISRIVNDGDRTNKAIAAALNQPLMVVNHILDVLQQDNKLSQFKPLNSEAEFEIVTISPILKRMLKGSSLIS